MIKTGIVMSLMNKKAGIMTSSGEFIYIKTNKVLPHIGEIYTGEVYKKKLYLFKYAITAATLMFILISGAFAYAYYTPVTSVVLGTNPSVSLKANRWNKIISFKALNSDGSLMLSNIKLKNKSIDAALELLVNEAKTEKYITDKKIINVNITSSRENSIDISNFKKIIDANNLNIKIDISSDNNKNIEVNNNNKIDTSKLNPNSNKKETTNKEQSDTKKDILKKPSVNINNNKIEDKSSIIKKESKNNDKTTINKEVESENKSLNNNSSSIKKSHTANEVENNGIDERNKTIDDRKISNYSNKSEERSYETHSHSPE